MVESADTQDSKSCPGNGVWVQLPPAAPEQKLRAEKGYSLEKIARQYGTSVEDIKKVNELKHDLIVVGQEILIPQS